METIIAKRVYDKDILDPANIKEVIDVCTEAKTQLTAILKNKNILCIPGNYANLERLEWSQQRLELFVVEKTYPHVVVPKWYTKWSLKNPIWGAELGTDDIIIITKPNIFDTKDLISLYNIGKTLLFIDGDKFDIMYLFKDKPEWHIIVKELKPWKALKIWKNIYWK